ncbi:putative endonuclease/Exonuclease/phosphatase family protein [Lyophyllum shimeji]|uniref:Endonuclease/Exonuclease/phosphatase family protein n=1 Tax=Lyophyllum shimeji TaxID=47721 RepID=A0A9P3UKT5_LYOSH|nr:putative endonuclease/Exonuclease/phosphatase family protein [Lyophyllum shimeji]
MEFLKTLACGSSGTYASGFPVLASIQAGVAYAMYWLSLFGFVTSCITAATSTTIAEIQGPAFQSPLAGQVVNNVTGLVTAKGPRGFWITGQAVQDVRVSNGLSVFSTSATILSQISPGDVVALSGRIAEFRSSTAPNDLFVTEIESPTNITVLSSNNTVHPVVLGVDRHPPTQLLTPLDAGPDGFLSVPNNVSRVEAVNATLQPDKYGLDFWESLEGELVQVRGPIALGFPNKFGEFWVHGDWKVTGKNSRGGLTLTFGPGGIPDSNPEAIIIGAPLDKTKNPAVAMGSRLTDITGVVTYQFGFYYILPTTAPSVISEAEGVVAPTNLTSEPNNHCVITFGDYNVENMAPNSAHLPIIADHIATYLNTPDIMFVQEIQDNSGPIDDGTVDGNITLANLVNSIAQINNVTYSFIEIAPVDGQDGGIPGGNIRQAYLYRPEKLSLVAGSPAGSSLDKVEVLVPPSHVPKLNFNPGRIEPTNGAWNSSRKPLVAHWETPSGQKLFTINVHLASKGGSSSSEGDARPPVNSPLEARTSQISLVASFVRSILAADDSANILLAGDFNEFLQARSLYEPLVELLTDIDEAAGIPEVERYSYVFDQNSEQLDHAFISKAIEGRGVKFEHIHINNWASSIAGRISDHDPSVGKIRLC